MLLKLTCGREDGAGVLAPPARRERVPLRERPYPGGDLSAAARRCATIREIRAGALATYDALHGALIYPRQVDTRRRRLRVGSACAEGGARRRRLLGHRGRERRTGTRRRA